MPIYAIEKRAVARAVAAMRARFPENDTFKALEDVSEYTTSRPMAKICRWYMAKFMACEERANGNVFFDRDPHHKMSVREYQKHRCDRHRGKTAKQEMTEVVAGAVLQHLGPWMGINKGEAN